MDSDNYLGTCVICEYHRAFFDENLECFFCQYGGVSSNPFDWIKWDQYIKKGLKHRRSIKLKERRSALPANRLERVT